LKVKTALVSVSDKTGLPDFAKGLSELGIKILSTGGTAKLLKENNIDFTYVSDYTDSPEMLDGRVKSIHPKIHAGLLARRDKKNHMSELKEHDIGLIDMVVVNLYPFKQTISKKDVTFDDAIENIDIGGPTLVRAAAKNHEHVAVVIDPGDYESILDELGENDGSLSKDMLSTLAVKAFKHTADYDSTISNYLGGIISSTAKFPEYITLNLSKQYDLRYGENPHQDAAFYADPSYAGSCIVNSKLLSGGKKLSFNNILDLDSAMRIAQSFNDPTTAIIKHLNPSGVGKADNIREAYSLAHKADSLSAFGCIVALNQPCDSGLAEDIIETFVEAVVAPGYEGDSLEILKKKKKMRVLEVDSMEKPIKLLDYRKVIGGMLVQDMDLREISMKDLKIVSKKKPGKSDIDSMLFAWKICCHTKSNSIIFAKENHTTGVGAGQMSRVDAVRIASFKAGDHAKGSAMASDAFFPFRDGIDEAAKAGITSIIQPGGSIRDQEVLDAVDEYGMSMVYTGVRCFLH